MAKKKGDKKKKGNLKAQGGEGNSASPSEIPPISSPDPKDPQGGWVQEVYRGLPAIVSLLLKPVALLAAGKARPSQIINGVADVGGIIASIVFIVRTGNSFYSMANLSIVMTLTVICIVGTDQRRRF